MTKNQIAQLDTITADFRNTFGHLTALQLNWKPDATTWSIAQNIDHLIVINETYYPMVKAVREGTYQVPFLGKFDFMVNFMGKMILDAVKPDRRKKMKTFPLWEPSSSELPADILSRFENHQQQLRQFMEDCADLIERKTVISSPANKNIVYRLETAFDIIVTHERRHFEQAKEVLDELKRKGI